jgi:hypothetical protein
MSNGSQQVVTPPPPWEMTEDQLRSRTGGGAPAAKPRPWEMSAQAIKAKAKAPPEESYSAGLKRTGEAFDKAVGTGPMKYVRTAEAAGELAVNVIPGVVGDVAGAVAGVATQNPVFGTKVRRGIQDYFAPETKTAKAAADYAAAAMKPVSKVVEAIPDWLEKAGHPLVAQTARAGIDLLGLAAPEGALTPRMLTSRAQAVAKATDMRLIIKPSETDSAKLGKYAEGMASTTRLSASNSLRNAPRVNEHIAQWIGLPKGTRNINETMLSRPLAAAKAGYKEADAVGVVQVGTQATRGMLRIGSRYPDVMKALAPYKRAYSRGQFNSRRAMDDALQLRADGNAELKAGHAYPPNPAAARLGKARLELADWLEKAVIAQSSRNAVSGGQGALGLGVRLSRSRQQLARLHVVERNLVGDDVNAEGLWKELDHGVKLDGAAREIAELYPYFRESLQNPSKVRNKVPLGALTGLMGIGAYEFMEHFKDPKRAAMLAGVVAGQPAVRRVLQSKPAQALHGLAAKRPKVTGRLGVAGGLAGKTAVAGEQLRKRRDDEGEGEAD